jgi:hypothetical protein
MSSSNASKSPLPIASATLLLTALFSCIVMLGSSYSPTRIPDGSLAMNDATHRDLVRTS